MKQKSYLKHYALAAILAGIAGTVTAEERVGVDPAIEAERAALESIANDRYGAVAGIVGFWGTETGYGEVWEAEFTAALNEATNEQLVDIQNAGNFDAVRAILQGQEAPVSMEGVAGPEALGSINQDLVFTPVVPCRIFDTRFDTDPNIGHATGPATTKSYQVYGSVTTMQNQGGSVACSAPKGEPVGIHGNFTAAPSAGTGKGNIRAWPFGGTLPSVSLVNYEAGVNIANAATVGTCYLCSFDLNVTTAFFASDQIGDVMGYYYPAQISALSDSRQGGYDLAVGAVNGDGSQAYSDLATSTFIGATSGSTTLSFTGGEEVVMRGSAVVSSSPNVTIAGTYVACYTDGATNFPMDSRFYATESPFCVTTDAAGWGGTVTTSGRKANMPSGTYTFGMCAMTGGFTGGCNQTSPNPGFSSRSTKIEVTRLKN